MWETPLHTQWPTRPWLRAAGGALAGLGGIPLGASTGNMPHAGRQLPFSAGKVNYFSTSVCWLNLDLIRERPAPMTAER